MSKTDILLLGSMALLVLPILIAMLASYISAFSKELRYVNSEIARTEGEERRYWLHRKRRLWLSLIPFVRY